MILKLQAAPAVPSGDAGVRTPGFGDAVAGLPIREFVEAIKFLDRAANAIIAVGHDVQTAE